MKFELALCQSRVYMEKDRSLDNAARMVREAAAKGAKIIALPELFSTPYSPEYIKLFQESAEGPTFQFLKKLAADLGVYLIGGSIPEAEGNAIYNTSFVFGRDGELIGRHRKTHLFDVDVKGGVRFMESEVLSPGEALTVVETEYCKIGVAICYDVRFPEVFRRMTLAGAELVVLPAAFNMTTGPAHWDLIMRMRAVDNQVYFAAVSPARDVGGPYQAYGNSCVATPWGEFCAHLGHREGIAYAEIDLDYLAQVREELPLLRQRRESLYV